MSRIKEIRIAKNLSQEQLAASMDLPVERIKLIEEGESWPTSYEFAQFAKKFKCPQEYLEEKIDTFNRFTFYRHQKVLTQDEFAEYLRVDEEDVKDWEEGKNLPCDDELTRICNILQCSPDYLLGKTHVNDAPKRTIEIQKKRSEESLKALVCPHCQGIDLSFVTEYHKSYITRILRALFKFLLFLCILNCAVTLVSMELPNDASLVAIILLQLAISITNGIEEYIESKTHVQAICKDCGHLWLLN